MTQLHFTLEYEFFIGLMSDSKDEAFAKIMKAILNQVLLAESTEQIGAGHYERSHERTDSRNGTRPRGLTTRIGKIFLDVPRHRDTPFSTKIFDAYERNEKALISTMMEMVVQGVSTRKIAKVTEELCGTTFSKSTVSDMCKRMDIDISDFRNRRLDKKYPFVLVDAIYIKSRCDDRVRSKGVLWAMGINTDGKKEVIGIQISDSETKDSWTTFFNSMKARGLSNVDAIISDSHSGLVTAVRECFEGSTWQRCQFHFQRNILDKVPKKYQKVVAEEIREMFNITNMKAARIKKDEIINEYAEVARNAMNILDEGFEDAMAVCALPEKYRKVLRTTNMVERENREIRRRESVIQVFPNDESALRLITAVLMDRQESWQSKSRTLDMEEYLEDRERYKKKLMQRLEVA